MITGEGTVAQKCHQEDGRKMFTWDFSMTFRREDYIWHCISKREGAIWKHGKHKNYIFIHVIHAHCGKVQRCRWSQNKLITNKHKDKYLLTFCCISFQAFHVSSTQKYIPLKNSIIQKCHQIWGLVEVTLCWQEVCFHDVWQWPFNLGTSVLFRRVLLQL